MTHHTHPLDEATRRLDPVDAERLSAAWRDSGAQPALFQHIVSQPVREQSTSRAVASRARTVLAVALGLLVVSAVGVSAAGLFADRDHDDTRMIGPAQAEAEVERLGADVPLPPGGSFDLLARQLRDSDSSQSEKGFAGMLAYNASCQWFSYWYGAQARGDAEAAENALATLHEIPSWKPYASVDGGAGGEGSTVTAMRELTEAAAKGDAAAVRWFLEVNCGPASGWDGPTRGPIGPGGS